MRLDRLACSRPERSLGPRRSAPWNGSTHPGYSGGKSADLIQLPKLVLGESEFVSRKIVPKLARGVSRQ